MTPTAKIKKLVNEAACSCEKESFFKLEDTDFGEAFIKCVIINYKVKEFYYISGNFSNKVSYSEARQIIRDYAAA